jgi:hypothetical protein
MVSLQLALQCGNEIWIHKHTVSRNAVISTFICTALCIA